MIAAAFGEDPGMAEADKAAGILPGKVITTLELASAAAKVTQNQQPTRIGEAKRRTQHELYSQFSRSSRPM